MSRLANWPAPPHRNWLYRCTNYTLYVGLEIWPARDGARSRWQSSLSSPKGEVDGSRMTMDRRAWLIVLGAGLLAGTLDIVYAIAFWAAKAGVAPQRIVQAIAAGLLGRDAFTGGALTAALGLALHYFIAITVAVTYYLVSGRIPLLIRRPVLIGAAYGLMLYGIMNLIVVPLSAAGPSSRDPLWIVLTIAVHMLLIGVPIALAARVARSTTASEEVKP